MAVYYVYSGAAGSNNGSSWANAFTTLTTAFATEAAGDTLYVAHDHAESTAGVTLTSSGTLSNPTKVVCVNRAGSVPPVAADLRATATVTSSGANNLTIAGSFTHYDGIIFISGTGAGGANIIMLNSNETGIRLDNCSLRVGTSSANVIYFGGSTGNQHGTYIEMNNTTLSFATTGDTCRLNGVVRWRNTPSALIGAAVPTDLFTPFNTGNILECCGVDLSAAGSGKNIIVNVGGTNAAKYRFLDCKLNASVNKVSGDPLGFGTNETDFIRCGSTGVNYATYRKSLSGALDHETTIVRTGGASDGTTPISWKIVTSANSNYTTPFECPPISIWNDTTGSSITAAIEGIWGGGAVPNDDDVWLEVEYLGDASSPQASFVNDGKAGLLATAAGQTSSSETWGGSTTKFKLDVSFTPQQKGWIYARVKCAKTSSTFYIDPKVTLSGVTGGKSYMVMGSYVNEPAGSSGPTGRIISIQRGTPY